jgi:hypothetical protein
MMANGMLNIVFYFSHKYIILSFGICTGQILLYQMQSAFVFQAALLAGMQLAFHP